MNINNSINKVLGKKTIRRDCRSKNKMYKYLVYSDLPGGRYGSDDIEKYFYTKQDARKFMRKEEARGRIVTLISVSDL